MMSARLTLTYSTRSPPPEEIMAVYFQYSRWDGRQHVFDLDEEDILDQLSKEVIEQGDLSKAMRDLFRQGLQEDHRNQC